MNVDYELLLTFLDLTQYIRHMYALNQRLCFLGSEKDQDGMTEWMDESICHSQKKQK